MNSTPFMQAGVRGLPDSLIICNCIDADICTYLCSSMYTYTYIHIQLLCLIFSRSLLPARVPEEKLGAHKGQGEGALATFNASPGISSDLSAMGGGTGQNRAGLQRGAPCRAVYPVKIRAGARHIIGKVNHH